MAADGRPAAPDRDGADPADRPTDRPGVRRPNPFAAPTGPPPDRQRVQQHDGQRDGQHLPGRVEHSDPHGPSQHGGGQHGGGDGGPPRPAPDPEALRVASRWVFRFALLVLAAVVCTTLPLPWQAAGVGFAVPAVVVGAIAIRQCVRARVKPSGVVFASVGVGLSVVLLLGQVAGLALWPVQSDLQECRASALTRSADLQCTADYQQRLEELSRFGGRLP